MAEGSLQTQRYVCSWIAALVVAFCGSLGAQSGPEATPASSVSVRKTAYDGLTISEITFRGLRGSSPAAMLENVSLKAGEIFDSAKLRASLKALYATGRFTQLDAEAEKTADGKAALIFVVAENYFVGTLDILGITRHTPTAHQLLNASKLELGALFNEEDVQRAAERMSQVLEDSGFYNSRITYTLNPHEESREMDVTFTLTPGRRARVGRVDVKGNSGFTAAQVQSITKLRPGEPLAAGSVRRALERLRRKYQKSGRLEAQVLLDVRAYRPETNTLDCIFNIERGPKVQIAVEGAGLSQRLIRRYIPVYEENADDDDLLNEGRRNLREYFQSKGYFNVQVDYTRKPQPAADKLSIVYDVDLGQRHTLKAIAIQGNKYFPEETIRARLSVQPASYLDLHGRFSQSMLTRDATSIKNLYMANGFLAVNVKTEVQEDYEGKSGEMRLLIGIEEGPQTRVRHLTMVGNVAIRSEELEEQGLSVIDGQPYSEADIATDRDVIATYYYNRGFPEMEMQVSAQPYNGNQHEMDVTYTIREGSRVFVDRVLVAGVDNTRPRIVQRQVQIHDGDPLNQLAMLETQRRLYDLGIFNQVDMAVQNPEGRAARKNVLFQLSEAKRWTFNYGLGFEVSTGSDPKGTASESDGTEDKQDLDPRGETGVSPRFSFEVTRLNFQGRDHTVTGKFRFGRLEQRALLSYDAPRLFEKDNWRLTVSAFYDRSLQVRTFTAERLEGSIQAEQIVDRALTLLYRMSYRRVSAYDLAISDALLPLYSARARIGMPSFTLIRDKRDDPIDAHRGNYTTADLGVAAGFFGSEASFGRVLIQNSTYHEFGTKKYVFARSTHIGMESPFSDQQIIPLPERFFSGGGNSLRGFSINQAGPRDPQTGFPVGGNAMFVNNLELRMPPPTLPFVQRNVSFVFFHDMGNVFDSASTMARGIFRLHQESTEKCSASGSTTACNFNYLSQAIGGGIRYRTPVGPIRIDLGYNLNPTRYPIKPETGPVQYGSTQRINVFFSIGQTF